VQCAVDDKFIWYKQQRNAASTYTHVFTLHKNTGNTKACNRLNEKVQCRQAQCKQAQFVHKSLTMPSPNTALEMVYRFTPTTPSVIAHRKAVIFLPSWNCPMMVLLLVVSSSVYSGLYKYTQYTVQCKLQ
jgi:hypothetical protein